ncbi:MULTISPECIES: P-type conjugative transfer ATPase TrbB [unclassified Caulobacter]|jgi:P-type conjugative transfer ATPase TrbB|uniref:P-type conjugative transfer ATPase TrbB n=2 Tax=Caulobacter TaxID=75 RepID=UPI000ADA7554|nr:MULTISPECIES: P-type conjugative transfer ATPase TrbB [unclassified Caulobacter]MBQ1561046.1 P-type conjugative transfer ATPase TrbB [Caulobacter sp.]
MSVAGMETLDRRAAMLRTAMGPDIAVALADPAVVEVMVNPDGVLRLDRLGEGRVDTGVSLAAAEVERIIRLVASHVRTEVHAGAPIVSADLPPRGEALSGERFEGVLPPISASPCFSIRKPASRIHTLDDYVEAGVMAPVQAEILRQAIDEHLNILIAGATSAGKTTLANALLAEVARSDERVILLQDTPELQCAAPDCVALRTRPGVVSLTDLVRSTLRLRPDRIVVGEVRGGEALDLLKAWNTGHPGGLSTVHANSARSALYRLEQLVQESVVTVPRRLIAEAVDLVVFIRGRGTGRRVETLARVTGLDSSGDYVVVDLDPPQLKALRQGEP